MRCSQTSTASKIKKRPSSSSSSSSLSSLYCSSSSTTDLQPPDQTAMTRKKKKKNATVRLSTEPQGVAARERRHRISERFKILKSLVPGGSKMDTVSMLDQAILYVKLLKAHIWLHQNATSSPSNDYDNTCTIDHYYNMASTTLHHDAQIAPYSLPFDHSHAYM